MADSAFIHTRIDPETKAEAERILGEIGMSPDQAIRLFYRQIAVRGEFPAELSVPNLITSRTLTDADQRQGLETYSSVSDLAASWEK